jgi:peptidyl-prolyl cis-trans isomerase C
MVLSLAVFSCGDGRVVATVDSEKITYEDLKDVSQRRAGLLGVEALPPGEEQKVLDLMIKREVAYLFAKEKGIKADDKAVEEAMKGLSFLDRLKHKKEIEKNLLLERVRERAAGAVRVSRKEIEEYYSSHMDEFSRPETYRVYLVKVEEERAFHVLSRAKRQPEAFDDMALRTETPGLRRINSNAPYTPKDGFPDEMQPFLDRMEIGDIAGPVNVKRGIFLFKLVDKRPPYVRPLKEAYFEIEHLVVAQKEEEAFERWYILKRKSYRIEIRSKELKEAGGEETG